MFELTTTDAQGSSAKFLSLLGLLIVEFTVKPPKSRVMTPSRIEKKTNKSHNRGGKLEQLLDYEISRALKIADAIEPSLLKSFFVTKASYQTAVRREACTATLNTNQMFRPCAGWRRLRFVSQSSNQEGTKWVERVRPRGSLSGLIIQPSTQLLCFPTTTKLFCWSLRDCCDEILTTICHLVNLHLFTRWRTRARPKWKFRKVWSRKGSSGDAVGAQDNC